MPAFDVKKFCCLGKKIIGAGLNYRSVVKERGLTPPTKPVVFLKPTSSYIVEGQQIQIPEGFEVHHEVELGVIIGKHCKNVSPCEVTHYIGGYCLALDLTAVNLMAEARSKGLPWALGKGFDTACPVSEALPADQLPEPDNVRLWLKVNGTLKQDCSTADMIFPTGELISFISEHMTLEPYDLVLTGAPAGIGPICRGDLLEAAIDSLISIKFTVKS